MPTENVRQRIQVFRGGVSGIRGTIPFQNPVHSGTEGDRLESQVAQQHERQVEKAPAEKTTSIGSDVRVIMGQVRRPKQPEPAAVKVVGWPRPRPKEGGEGEPAYVHAIWQERWPKQKTKTGEAGAEQAAHRRGGNAAAETRAAAAETRAAEAEQRAVILDS